MLLMFLPIFLLILVSPSKCSTTQPRTLAVRDTRQPRCTHVRTHHMWGADCNGLNLALIPLELNSNIEILDATFNRIRELYNTSFLNYDSLRFLYLADNSIAHIEPGTFDPLEYLEVLDLSLNSLHAIPAGLENIHSLWKLMLSSNPLGRIFFESMPMLEVLALAKCKQKTLPNLTALPGLKTFNFSSNNLKTITVPDIAPLCRLKELDIRGNSRLFVNSYCDCVFMVQWSSERNFRLLPSSDTICVDVKQGSRIIGNSSYCYTNETEIMLDESMSIARSCESEVLQYGGSPIRVKSYLIWIIVAAVCTTSLLGCCLILYCAQRRQKKRIPTPTEERPLADNS